MSSPDDMEAGRREIEAQGGELIADVSEEAAELRAFARQVAALPGDAAIPPEVIQRGLTALVRHYSVQYQLGERWSPFAEGRPMPATAAMIMATAMLRAVNVETFELGMWQAWAGS